MGIGDRIKQNYEAPSKHLLVRRTPVIVRVDGKAFHTFTRGMDKPFDTELMNSMTDAAISLARQMQGFVAGYIQSDEASFFLQDFSTFVTEPWFGYVKSKVETISSSVMTAEFNESIRARKSVGSAYFDARAFNLPMEEVANYFLWRSQDWGRNSLAMYCGSKFSHKQLQGKSNAERHEMLHSIGCNWAADLSARQKNGTWINCDYAPSYSIGPSYPEIDAFIRAALDSIAE